MDARTKGDLEMKELREILAKIERGDTLDATAVKAALSEVELEISALRAAVSVLYDNILLSGPKIYASLANMNVNNGRKQPGVRKEVSLKVLEIAHSLDEAIEPRD